jgi:uncharacterized membrane protein YphA (DoxX/SURF4 family)
MPHTLSLFPSLFAYSLIGTMLLRITLGVIFVVRGNARRKSGNQGGWVELAGGVLLLVGLWTQAAALILGLLSLYRSKKTSGDARMLLVLLAVVSLALVLLGPGMPAVDLPL